MIGEVEVVAAEGILHPIRHPDERRPGDVAPHPVVHVGDDDGAVEQALDADGLRGRGRNVRTRIGHEPVPVRHLDARQRRGVDPVLLADEIVEEEHVGDRGVDLVRRQRSGLVERHGAVDVVPQRGGRRPVAAHGLARLVGRQQALSPGQPVVRPLGAGGAVARGATAVVHRPPLGRGRAAGRQLRALRAHDGSPALDVRGRRRAAEPERLRPGRAGAQQRAQQHPDGRAGRVGKRGPPRFMPATHRRCHRGRAERGRLQEGAPAARGVGSCLLAWHRVLLSSTRRSGRGDRPAARAAYRARASKVAGMSERTWMPQWSPARVTIHSAGTVQ